MKEICLGRQPIYDSAFEVDGYQLSCHPTDSGGVAGNNLHPQSEDGLGQAGVLLDTLAEIGLEQLVGNSKVFLHAPHSLLLQGALRQLTIPIPRIVFTVALGRAVDRSLHDALNALRQDNYRFLLDEYVHDESCQALLEVADQVRLNVANLPKQKICQWVESLHQRGLSVIASGIEDQETLETCQKAGFDFFQGRHFSQPRLLRFQGIQTNQLAVLRLVSALNQPDVDVRAIAALIAQDVSLSYKLLRYINSAYFSLPQRVESIQRAVALMGVRTVRSWAILISLSGAENARSDLMNIALVRARMCELLAGQLATNQPDASFTVGLLSVLDLVAQAPMPEVLATLPLGEDVNGALLHHEGVLGRILACTLAYEQCDWTMLQESGLDIEQMNEAYMTALADAYRASYELSRD